MRKSGILEARRVARALVFRLGISAAEHIRIEAIAKRLGARVVEAQLDGAQAQLVRSGTDAKIIVSKTITDTAVRRFSIAHELGHFVLNHPSVPAPSLCGPVSARRYDPETRDFEAEANAFAGELLIPYELVHTWCETSPVTMSIPWRIAKEFNVSILAAAIQFAELTSERCAAVFSSQQKVVWSRNSVTFTREIERGKRIDPDSVAWDFFKHGELDDRAQPVPADAWLDTSAQVDIYEHSIASIEHGTVLSLLWIPETVAAPLGMLA